MSVQTEITRIESAKTAIATAIESKGVTVPDGTLLDGMAPLIESIEAGGCTITSGSFTPASDPTYGYTVTHGLGKIPELFVCWISQDCTGTSVRSYYLYGIYSNSLEIDQASTIYNDTVSIFFKRFDQITETTIHVKNVNSFTTKAYSWIAVG